MSSKERLMLKYLLMSSEKLSLLWFVLDFDVDFVYCGRYCGDDVLWMLFLCFLGYLIRQLGDMDCYSLLPLHSPSFHLA